ncbi:dehydrogenase E1 component-domain-containing protein [Panaeolus papilionaceus]|nr:dehydrogenase E1 component-domain-containing protein [Panaeolus papilionaceus]
MMEINEELKVRMKGMIRVSVLAVEVRGDGERGRGNQNSMSDPGTTYRTREEVQRMRSTQDPIRGLQKNIEEWGIATEQELKQLDKEAKTEVDAAVAEAKESPEPTTPDLWNDIYFKGTEPPFMRDTPSVCEIDTRCDKGSGVLVLVALVFAELRLCSLYPILKSQPTYVQNQNSGVRVEPRCAAIMSAGIHVQLTQVPAMMRTTNQTPLETYYDATCTTCGNVAFSVRRSALAARRVP